MPDKSVVVPAVIAIAVLVIIATGLDWLIAHMELALLAAFGVGGAIYLLRRRAALRNRV